MLQGQVHLPLLLHLARRLEKKTEARPKRPSIPSRFEAFCDIEGLQINASTTNYR
jgi:hypothetical protein